MKLEPSFFSRILTVLFALLCAAPAAAQDFGSGLVDTGNVIVVNRRTQPIYVAFSAQPGVLGPVTWSSSCQRYNNEVRIYPGQSCRASVPASAGPARFCASEYPTPAGKAPNCFDAQRTNQTIVETNFSNGVGCYPSQKSCIWYDINVTPASCTDCEWQADNCKAQGGPAYNLPVHLACPGSPSFTCRGPIAPMGPNNTKYPSQCGLPFAAPNCIGGLNAACLQAFFFPMSTSGACKYPPTLPRPIAQCPQGEPLTVTFLDGY